MAIAGRIQQKEGQEREERQMSQQQSQPMRPVGERSGRMVRSAQLEDYLKRFEVKYSAFPNSEARLAKGLGWFSIGLGLSQIIAPRALINFIGVKNNAKNVSVMRLFGVRELATGVGILSWPKPVGWLWGRVSGDLIDIALLVRALNSNNSTRNRVAFALANVLGVTALDLLASVRLSRNPRAIVHEIRLTKTITINRPPEELYQFWHNFENLPHFMYHLESVQVIDQKRSHWVAKAPAGMKAEWDAEIIEEIPNKLIAWRAIEGSDVYHSGSVQFKRAPGGRGTEVRVEMEYIPPVGEIGVAIAKLMREEPGQQMQEDLRRFKQIMETGVIVVSEGNLSRAAQPPETVPAKLRSKVAGM
jgi:uncharacterized membrane protein